MQLHEIKFEPLDLNPGWGVADLDGGHRIWVSPEGAYTIERDYGTRYSRTVIWGADALTAQCILHDIFK